VLAYLLNLDWAASRLSEFSRLCRVELDVRQRAVILDAVQRKISIDVRQRGIVVRGSICES
jgi:hypothetical protein